MFHLQNIEKETVVTKSAKEMTNAVDANILRKKWEEY
jgi:hypothetical protein